MTTRPLQFLRRGQPVALGNVPPDRTLLEDLAEDPLIQPVGDAATAPGQTITLHPAQEALVLCHGSQCGFCTPGFVMSLFGMYQNHVCHGQPITRERAQEELSGNLCRCTGYRPI